MTTHLQYGDLRDRLIKAGITDPLELPPRASLPPHLLWVWRAWHRLTHDRPFIGGGFSIPVPGRIPWASVLSWSKFHGYSRDQTKLLDRGLEALDRAYMKHWHLNTPKEPRGPKGSVH